MSQPKVDMSQFHEALLMQAVLAGFSSESLDRAKTRYELMDARCQRAYQEYEEACRNLGNAEVTLLHECEEILREQGYIEI